MQNEVLVGQAFLGSPVGRFQSKKKKKIYPLSTKVSLSRRSKQRFGLLYFSWESFFSLVFVYIMWFLRSLSYIKIKMDVSRSKVQ